MDGLVESLPRTLCHLDCWANNAIAADDGTDVLVDWSFAGDGAVGEDPGNWVPDTLFDFFLESEEFGAARPDGVVDLRRRPRRRRAGPTTPDVARLAMCAAARSSTCGCRA